MQYKALYAVMVLSTALLACSKHQDVATTEVVPEHTLNNSGTDHPNSVQNKIVKQLNLTVIKVKVGSMLEEQLPDKNVPDQKIADTQASNTTRSAFKENTTFGRNDAVHLMVETVGTGNATLKAQWGYMTRGKQKYVDTSSQPIIAAGPMVVQFIMRKDEGLKVGSYRVEIWLDDALAGIKEFRVE